MAEKGNRGGEDHGKTGGSPPAHLYVEKVGERAGGIAQTGGAPEIGRERQTACRSIAERFHGPAQAGPDRAFVLRDVGIEIIDSGAKLPEGDQFRRGARTAFRRSEQERLAESHKTAEKVFGRMIREPESRCDPSEETLRQTHRL